MTNYKTGGALQHFGDGTRDTGGLFADATLTYGIFNLLAGLRMDHYRLDGVGGPTVGQDPSSALPANKSENHFSPRVALSAQVLPWLQPYVSYAQAYRAPTVTETLMPGFHGSFMSTLANPHLAGERSEGWELGVNIVKDSVLFAGDAFRFKVNYFDHDVSNYIIMSSMLKFTNVAGATRIHGVELQGGYDMGLAYVNLSYTKGETALPTGFWVGLTVDHYNALPDDYYTLDAGVRLFDKKLTVGGVVRHVGNSKWYGTASNIRPVPAYTLYDLYATYQHVENLSFFLNVENITDVAYAPTQSAYSPASWSGDISYVKGRGRTLMGGLTLKF